FAYAREMRKSRSFVTPCAPSDSGILVIDGDHAPGAPQEPQPARLQAPAEGRRLLADADADVAGSRMRAVPK
ncbi:MAG: hypothetical protein WCI67_13450, partial [Chloroflexales bacterium]